MKRTNWLSNIPRVVLLICFLAFAILPIYWVVVTSLKPAGDALKLPIEYFPSRVTFDNYIAVFKDTAFPTFYMNSLIVSIVSAFFTLILSLFAAYSLSRFTFRGKRLTLFMFLITQMFPVVVMIVPLFIGFSKLGLIDSLVSLIVCYSIFNIPFCTVMIKGFFDQTPIALEEAAQIDGCTRFQTLLRILLPILMPGIASTFVFAFISSWNEYFLSLMFIHTEELKTIPVGMSVFIGKFEVNWSLLSAGTIMAILPSLALFMIVQKYLIRGLTAGAVK